MQNIGPLLEVTVSPSIELAASPPDSILMELPLPSFELAPPLSSILMESLAPSIELVAPLDSTLACESLFMNLDIHISTITNFSGAHDIVPIISLGLEDHVILNLCDLVGNVCSSKCLLLLPHPNGGSLLMLLVIFVML